MDLLCKKCDVFVGHQAAGVAKVPDEHAHDNEWLANHCWVCGRSRSEIESDQYDLKPSRDRLQEHLDNPSTEVTKYVDKAMFSAQPISEVAMERPIVHLLSATPDPLGALAAACMIYEGRAVHNLNEITDQERRFYWDDIWNTTLQAPLEDIDFHFVVEGLTRASWDQMVRQRTANFGGESLRFSVKLPLTTVVRPGPTINTEKRLGIHKRVVEAIEMGYAELIDDGAPAEDARGLIPLNVLVQGHWKTNMRNLATEIGKRTCTQAQWEWRMILLSMRDAIRNFAGYRIPFMGVEGTAWQFQYIADYSPLWRPVCFTTGRCMFRAKADRGCTIRERVEAGRFDEVQPEEYMLDPTAAWVK
jgi:flavin-dependent thymidylate synthase